MVAVDDPDPPSEAKIKPEYMAVPSSALPSNALAAAASAWGETSTDELPDDNEEQNLKLYMFHINMIYHY